MGVILFILLTGCPPFNGDDDKAIIKKVRMGYYDRDLLTNNNVSEDAVDFIQGLLNYDPESRLTALQAMDHKWLTSKADFGVNRAITQQALSNLRKFRADKKLQQAAITFIVQ